MRKACTELKNKYMESFLKNCGLFDITVKQDPKSPEYTYNPVCSKCGFVNDECSQFCAKDGTSLKKQVEQYTLTTICPKCQAANPEGAIFCTQCGASLKIVSADPIYSQKFDILFCDSVDYHDKKIQAEKKVYLACNQIEYINEMHRFDEFGYYIGFGTELYNKLEQEFGFETSKVLDGFVYDQKYEDQFEDKEFDIFVIGDQNHCGQFNLVENLCLFHVLELVSFYNKFLNINLKIGTNIEYFNNDIYYKNIINCLDHACLNNKNYYEPIVSLYKNISFVNFTYPYKYINKSNYILYISLLNSNLHLISGINEKLFISDIPITYIYHTNDFDKEFYTLETVSLFFRHEKIKNNHVFKQIQIIYSELERKKKLKSFFTKKQFLINPNINVNFKNIINSKLISNISLEFIDIINKI